LHLPQLFPATRTRYLPRFSSPIRARSSLHCNLRWAGSVSPELDIRSPQKNKNRALFLFYFSVAAIVTYLLLLLMFVVQERRTSWPFFVTAGTLQFVEPILSPSITSGFLIRLLFLSLFRLDLFLAQNCGPRIVELFLNWSIFLCNCHVVAVLAWTDQSSQSFVVLCAMLNRRFRWNSSCLSRDIRCGRNYGLRRLANPRVFCRSNDDVGASEGENGHNERQQMGTQTHAAQWRMLSSLMCSMDMARMIVKRSMCIHVFDPGKISISFQSNRNPLCLLNQLVHCLWHFKPNLWMKNI
jgi:hypothetical protein